MALTVETLYYTIYHSKYFIELNFDKSTQYVALWTHLSGELWSVFYEYFNRNWSCYKGFLLYLHFVMFFLRLRTILLDFNHLTAFCMQQIKYLPSTVLISLNNNNITDVRFDDLQLRKERLVLTLYNNPLQCDKGWNDACDDSPKHSIKSDLICGDTVQVLKFDNPLSLHLFSFQRDGGDIANVSFKRNKQWLLFQRFCIVVY